MPNKEDLLQAKTSCEAAMEKYTAMVNKTDDTVAKQMYEHMCGDMDRHLNYLNSRISDLNNEE